METDNNTTDSTDKTETVQTRQTGAASDVHQHLYTTSECLSEDGLAWARHHVRPRNAIFIVTTELGGPNPELMLDTRFTRSTAAEGASRLG